MAYSGGIRYLNVSFGEVEWIDNLRFDKERALITDVGSFQDCTMEPIGKHHEALISGGMKKGWIRYDVEECGEVGNERCVIVGKTCKMDEGDTASHVQEYYILVVRPTGVCGEYERAGVGLIQSDCVVRQRVNVRLV